jgi:hypothetical protein
MAVPGLPNIQPTTTLTRSLSMTVHPFAPSPCRSPLRPGQPVHVNAHAAWLPATVVSVAHTAIQISLRTATAGVMTRSVAPWVVQPADGRRLAPAGGLRPGDQVVAADSSVHTVAGIPWQSRDGWWVVTYTSGELATLPPTAVLRIVDPAGHVIDAMPEVTGNAHGPSLR